MATGSNVPLPSFTSQGFQAPSAEAILAGVIQDWVNAFGSAGFNLNLAADNSESLTTPQGQLATSLAAIIGNVYAEFVTTCNLFDPAFTYGRYQDAIGRIYYMQRIPGAATLLQVNCIGQAGVTIPGGPQGALINDASDNIYQCTTTGVIPVSGNITLPFACITPGPGPIPVPEDIEIYQAIASWDDVTLVSGVVGQNVESRSAFETRRFASVASNSMGQLASILGAVLAVPGVLDAYVYENDNATPLTVQGFTLAPNSVYVAVVGGDSKDVGHAIWTKKAPGCAYNGNTTVQVQDTSAGYTPPYPTYDVTFEIPPSLPFVVSVTMADNGQQPANATSLIQTAVVGSFEGEDNNIPPQPGAKIATKFFASRLY
ncbi:MAG TPA: baseplate J/gp47 family protein, partial [Blastocatellia bacterium]|nr:baseplate J/gp47 family protein [Blastocatellia bacterium]